jgi:hypothetical protein
MYVKQTLPDDDNNARLTSLGTFFVLVVLCVCSGAVVGTAAGQR